MSNYQINDLCVLAIVLCLLVCVPLESILGKKNK